MTEQLKVIISAEIDKLKKAINDGKRLIDNFSEEGQEAFSSFNDEIQKAGGISKKALAITAGAIAGVTTALLTVSGKTKEYRQQQAMLQTAFETAGGSAETAKQTYNDLYRVLGDSGKATEAAQHLAKLTTNEKELAEWTNICQGVYATFGESISTESLTEAINHTSKLGEVQGTLADALEWSGVNVDDFNEQLFWCNSESEREKLIRDTLNGLYTDAAANYEVNAASILEQNEAQASLTETLAQLGETMEPVLTLFTQLGNEVLAELAPHIEGFVSEHLPQLKDILLEVATAIGDVITWIVDNWDFVSTLAAIILGIAAAISVVSTVMAVVNAVMMASPVTWIVLAIVAAVAALVAIIVVCIKYWDEIKAAVMVAVNAIYNAFSNVANWINNNVIKPIANFFVGLWNGIVNVFKGVGSWFGNVFSSAWNGIKKAWSGVTNFFSNIWNSIKNTFSKVGEVVGKAITNTVKKAINAVLGTAVKIINGFINAINWAIGIINKIPGVNINKLNTLEVPKLAKGGVVDGATLAMIGENGKEAVVPLENNTEWLDKLAERLNKLTGGNGRPIYLTVDGKVFAKTAITTINDLTKQTGRLDLVLA